MSFFGIQVGLLQIAMQTRCQELLQQPYSYQNGRHGKHREYGHIIPHIWYTIDDISPYIRGR